MIHERGSGAPDRGPSAADHGSGSPDHWEAEATAHRQPPSFRLLTTLAVAGALAGLLIVGVYQTTLPAIERNRAERLERAIREVLPGTERFETIYLVDGVLLVEPPADLDTRRLERIYLGIAAGGRRTGFAIPAGEAGFMDVIHLIFGYDPGTATVLGMKVLDSKETPGLGDKIEKDQAFVAQFRGARAPLVKVKPGTRRAPEEVDLITGATISARTVVDAINNAIARWTPALDAFLAGGAP